MTIQQVQALIMDALTDLNESMSRVDRSTTISDPQVQQVLTDLFGSDADGQREGDNRDLRVIRSKDLGDGRTEVS